MAKTTKRTNAHQGNVTSVSDVRATRAVDAITPAFVEWCRHSEGLPAESAMELLRPIRALVAAYFHASPSSEATNFEPVPFGLAMADLLGTEGEDVISFSFDAIHVYLEFLGETGAWTGTDDDFNAVDDFFHMNEEHSLPEIAAPKLTSEEELAALAGTGLACRLEKLLQWLGQGKTVTSTGALRLKEVEGAAAAVGVAAKGAMPHTKREKAPTVGSEPGSLDSVLTVKSMYEVSLLAKFWAALEACHFIDIGSTKVRLTPLAEKYLDPEQPGRLESLGYFTAMFLEIAVLGEEDWAPWITHAAMAQSAILFAACTDAAPPVDVLTDTEKLQAVDLDEYGAKVLRRRMEELSDLGLVVLDSFITVPPAVIPAVAALMQSAFHDEEGSVSGPWEQPVASRKAQPKAPIRRRKKSSPAQILQLKIMLKGSKPPVWRRLLVRSDLTLEQFHHVIQQSFEWLDYHLHEFRVGGYNGTAYGPAGNDFGFGDPPQNEAEVAVGEILSKEKDKMDYVYDFGDDWDHAITVEKVLPDEDGVPAVRCTGGRGAGPAEDSGGVWGWQGIIAAVNDPSHPGHDEYRDWLGLGPRESLDPKEFDKDALNEDLVDLF